VAVANGRCSTSKIIDLVDLDVERESYVVPHDLEAMVIKQMIDIALRAGEEIVDAYDIPTNWRAIAHRDANRESQPPVTNTHVSRCRCQVR